MLMLISKANLQWCMVTAQFNSCNVEPSTVTHSSFDNVKCHVTEFRPISEAARSWSYDKTNSPSCILKCRDTYILTMTRTTHRYIRGPHTVHRQPRAFQMQNSSTIRQNYFVLNSTTIIPWPRKKTTLNLLPSAF